MYQYIAWVLLVLAFWRIAWLAIYWASGFYVGSITINNGISVNNLEINHGIRISASSVRLRLWGNTRKLVVSNLRLGFPTLSGGTNHKTKTGKYGTRNCNSPLSLYPTPRFARSLVKSALRFLKKVDIELQYSLLEQEKLTAKAETILFLVTSSPSSLDRLKYKIRIQLRLSKALAEFKLAADNVSALNLGSGSVTFSFSVDSGTGYLSDIAARIFIDEFDFNVLFLFKKMVFPSKCSPDDQEKVKAQNLDAERELLTRIYKQLSPCFKEFSINIAYLCVKGIPLIPASPDCSLSEYFSFASKSETLYISVDTISINLERILSTSAGFEIHFNKGRDVPVNFTCSSLLIKAGFASNSGILTMKPFPSVSEFLSIPNISITFKTNAVRNLFDGLGFKDSVLEFCLSGNSPTLDIDHHQLAILAYNYNVWRKIIKFNKIYQTSTTTRGIPNSMNSDSDEDTGDETKVLGHDDLKTRPNLARKDDSFLIADKFIRLLEEYYPQIDTKVTIEQPRILLRVQNDKDQKLQILMLSYSMMILHVLTTDNQDYEAECQFIHPNVMFTEKRTVHGSTETFNEEVCGLIDAKFSVCVFENLKVESKMRLNGGYINLIKPDVLNGLHDIISETNSAVSLNSKTGLINLHFDSKIKEFGKATMEALSHTDSSDKPRSPLFTFLPSWFVSLDFRCDDCILKLGSASPLLPPNYIPELSDLDKQLFAETESNLVLEISTISAGLYKSLPDDASKNSSLASSSGASSYLETLAGESPKEVFWTSLAQVNNIRLNFVDDYKQSLIVSVPALTHKLAAISEASVNKLSQDISVQAIHIGLDTHKLFTLFGLAYLITQTVVTPLKKLHERIKKNNQSLMSASSPKTEGMTINSLRSTLTIDKIDLVLALSEKFKIRLQNYNSQVELANGIVYVANRLLRAMVISSIANHWDRVLCIDTLAMKIGDPSEQQSVMLSAPSIRIIQPHGFVVYKLFDNLSVFIKIAKHLASCFQSDQKTTTVSPKVSEPIVSPGIRLSTGKLSFNIEDDPFDSELNMIYQLGIVEQRKRQEHLSLFEQQLKRGGISEDLYHTELEALYKHFEQLWIRKVQVYKKQLQDEILKHENFLFGSESNLPESENERLKEYSLHAPLLSVMLTGVTLDLSKPKFSLEALPDFIHRYGQGVPKSTKYNLMIPSFMDLSVEELRMHLRDYPLPLFHLPFAKDTKGLGRALKMHGHLIICEALNTDVKHLRELKVQLTSATDKPSLQPKSFDKLIIEKSLSTVKLFTDMNVMFDSESPSRFVWGQSYQFGIQQIMLTVDQFSKPPVDPSRKLGFWDKVRMVIHGSLSIETGRDASIEVAFKSGRDPYDLFGDSNGFILSFKQSVVWRVNKHDDSLRFFEILAQTLSWYIPNYLANPLVCWLRDSSKPTYFPKRKDFLNSCFGYYLEADPPSASPGDMDWCEKKVVEISGGLQFTVGFLLQRFCSEKKLTSECKPHYEIELYNPEFTKEGHDSYNGFRSDRVHMAISIKAHNNDSYNTIHLSPGTFRQFFSWWSIFQGNMMLPIRKGKLFQEVKSSPKFSEHLFTNKFLFEFKNLFISHIFQKDNLDTSSDDYDCVGLRAKVENFSVDLHQRKEEIVDIHEDLSRHKKVMKMKFNLGQVILNKIDLRTVEANFHRNMYRVSNRETFKPPKHFLEVFDNDRDWFDLRDYVECFWPLIGDVKSAKILPLLYSETFVYVRDTTEDEGLKEILEQKMHDCVLNKREHKSSEIETYKRRKDALAGHMSKKVVQSVSGRIEALQEMIRNCETKKKKVTRSDSTVSLNAGGKERFHNRFLLVSMFLKWNQQVRNQFMQYIHFVNLSSTQKKFLSFEFMNVLEDIIKKNENASEQFSHESGLSMHDNQIPQTQNKLQNSEQRLHDFEKIIRLINGIEKIVEDYKVEIISPQIQLHTEELKDSVVIITAPSLESKIFSVVINKDVQTQSSLNVLEKRYGVILNDASVMVVDKADIEQKEFAFELSPYGTKTRWPPFLGIETCKHHEFATPENVLVEQMSLMLTYNQVVALSSSIEQMENNESADTNHENLGSSSDQSADKLRVDVPRLAINCTSKQYFTLYATVLSLLLYVEPMAAELREKLLKLNFSIDFQDYCALQDRLMRLYDYLGLVNELLKNYNFRLHGHLGNEDLNDYLLLRNKKSFLETEIVLMQQTLFSGNRITESHSRVIQDWRIAADKIVLHMLNDDRSQIIDLSIANGVYQRRLKDDGSNDNRVEIMSIDGISRLPDSHFETFLEPLMPHHKDTLIEVDWSMNRVVGGIKIIDNFDIRSLPLNIRIDQKTGSLLMKFIFRQSEGKDLDESPIIKFADRAHGKQGGIDRSGGDKTNSEGHDASSLTRPAKKSDKSTESKLGEKESTIASSSKIELDEDVNAMISRSKKYFSIAKMTSRLFEIMISLRMESGIKRWLNVTNFLLVLPRWEIERQVLSLLEIVDLFKSLVIKALLSHSGSLLGNKFTSRETNLRRYKKRAERARLQSFNLKKSPTGSSLNRVRDLPKTEDKLTAVGTHN